MLAARHEGNAPGYGCAGSEVPGEEVLSCVCVPCIKFGTATTLRIGRLLVSKSNDFIQRFGPLFSPRIGHCDLTLYARRGFEYLNDQWTTEIFLKSIFISPRCDGGSAPFSTLASKRSAFYSQARTVALRFPHDPHGPPAFQSVTAATSGKRNNRPEPALQDTFCNPAFAGCDGAPGGGGDCGAAHAQQF